MDLTFLYTGLSHHTWRLNFGTKKEIFEANSSQNFGPSVIDGSEAIVYGTVTDISGTPYVYLPDKKRNIKYK